VLVGDGLEAERLRTLARRLGLDAHVRFVGYRRDLSSIYAGLDLVVIPSLSEGLPNVLLEALLHRRAVVATRVGAISEVLSDGLGRWLVPPGDVRALADTITMALRDAPGREELGRLGQRLVRERFTPALRVDRVIAVYRELRTSRLAMQA
jgi:glycosyltransferase involved in cell wall biosynthesis